MLINKIHLALVGTTLTTIAFLGCGGIDNKPEDSTNWDNVLTNMPDRLKHFVNTTPVVNGDFIAYQNVENSINQHNLVNLKFVYASLSDYCAYAIASSDNHNIGENFIYFEPNQYTAGFMRISHTNSGNAQRASKGIKPLSILSRPQDNTIINDALANSPKNLNHTVTFTIQKTTTGDCQISNIQVSGLNLTLNNFTLQSTQYISVDTDLKQLQIMLSTLFVNFNRAKDIFN